RSAAIIDRRHPGQADGPERTREPDEGGLREADDGGKGFRHDAAVDVDHIVIASEAKQRSNPVYFGSGCFAELHLAPLAAGLSHMTELSRTLMRSWPRTISHQVVPANAGTHNPWPQKVKASARVPKRESAPYGSLR